MLDANTKKASKDDPSIREIKIRNIVAYINKNVVFSTNTGSSILK